MKKTHLPALFSAFSLLAMPAAVHADAVPWVGITGEGSTEKDFSRGMGEIFLPLYQCPDKMVLFAYGRASKYARKHLTEVAAGLGCRYVTSPRTALGLNVLYDGYLTTRDNWFNYISVGGEGYACDFDGHLNFRIPVGTTKKSIERSPRVLETFLLDDEVKLRTRLDGKERSRWSFDGEIGYRICCDCVYIRPYIGGQYCQEKTNTRIGYLGTEFYNAELDNFCSRLQVTAGAYVGYDFDRKVLGSFYISLRPRISKRCSRPRNCCCPVASRLSDPVIQRLRPCTKKQRGEIITESATTLQYPVNGIWVSYEANGHTLQTQINKAFASGGNNTMIFADGLYSADGTFLNSTQVLAGGSAGLSPRGIISGASLNWGQWGNFTNNPGVIENPVLLGTGLTMNEGSSVDTMFIRKGKFGVVNAAGAGNLIINKVETSELVGTFNAASPSVGILLVNSNNSLVSNSRMIGSPTGELGFLVSFGDSIILNGNSTTNNQFGNAVVDSTNITINEYTSVFDGNTNPAFATNALTLLRVSNALITNADIDGAGNDGISVLSGENISITNSIIRDSWTDGIFLGTNSGKTLISNVIIDGFGLNVPNLAMPISSSGIQAGGSASSVNLEIVDNLIVQNVQIISKISANTEAGLLLENKTPASTATASINGLVFSGLGDNIGFEIRTLGGADRIYNISGTGNILFIEGNPSPTFCEILQTAGSEINGKIFFNNGQSCPP